MITFRDDHDVDLELLADLRARCGFTARARDELAQMVAGARWIASAHDDAGGLVGFARAVSDAMRTGSSVWDSVSQASHDVASQVESWWHEEKAIDRYVRGDPAATWGGHGPCPYGDDGKLKPAAPAPAPVKLAPEPLTPEEQWEKNEQDSAEADYQRFKKEGRFKPRRR